MKKDLFALSSYSYELPQELIAQAPCEPRDHSRLLIINRQTGNMMEVKFRDLIDFLQPKDQLIFNDTKVISARLFGTRSGGGQTEIFLIKKRSFDTWEVLARPGKKLREGSVISFAEDFNCTILETTESGSKIAQFFWKTSFEESLDKYGNLPLPPYIQRHAIKEDQRSYQTVFASTPGAVAAPTAGLHFTGDMLEKLSLKQIKQSKVTLHVGLGTFKPVQVDDIRLHPMHTEEYFIKESTARELNEQPKDARQICVGTTSCRVIESAADEMGRVHAGSFETGIFIYPGYKFKAVRGMITNFHLPCSTLLMLVCAFGGYDLIMEAYRKAIADKFRFYSYGDAMLII